MTDRVFILGAGRAGRGLARALRASGVTLAGLHGRRVDAGEDIVSAGTLPPSLREATAILVAVRDAQLDQALGELLAGSLPDKVAILQLSGSDEPAASAAVRAAGHAYGTFHPLLPLADPARAMHLFRGGWVGVAGDPGAVGAARQLAAALGARTIAIPVGARARYHAAAVMASNFPTVLAALAERLLAESGVDADAGRAAVRSLMAAAVGNLRDTPPEKALTGPIVRGDVETVRRHLVALEGEPSTAAVYHCISRAALQLLRESGGLLDQDRAEEMQRALERGAGNRDRAAVPNASPLPPGRTP